jgi:WD40 repeat protein
VGGVGKIGNVDALAGLARVEVFDWAKGERTHEFSGGGGLVTSLRFHPQGDWLLAAGGGKDFVWFLDLAAQKIAHEHKAPMFVHAVAFNDDYDTLYAVGHNKVAVMDWKG